MADVPSASRCSIQHRWGSSEEVSSIDQLADLLEELEADDPEHPDVWISDNEAGYSVSAFEGSRGLVIWEDHDEARGPLHMEGYSRAGMLDLFRMVLQGRADEVDSLPWLPGYGN
ncbi:hypothetical protein KBX37_06165 [Micromonospora sp. U56]|uniref:hypothetical protein n=1 Tax=unclassified Micromonospora TaxID=2617518 RepID=UPI001B362023|nr:MULTISPECIES: hypothetical protein [unclassified Micromonospora]MBQ0892692.1 hypothetical protein [Micromonospora sp. U56]MDH6465640.1 hypothetical protein [Micromonospora sp. A200]